MAALEEATEVTAKKITIDPSPAMENNDLDVKVSPERLPKEIMDRIIKMLYHEAPPKKLKLDKSEPDRSNPNKEKSNYSALWALQRTSREMYMHVTPYIWREYEGDIMGFVRLFRLLEPIENDLPTLGEARPRDDREGHPIDWTYATRAFWMFTFLRKLIYRPIVESESWISIAEPVFDKLYELQFKSASGSVFADLVPALEDAVLDTSRYQGYFSAWENVRSVTMTPEPDTIVPISFLATLEYQDKGIHWEDMVSDFSHLVFIIGNFLPCLNPTNTCVRFGLDKPHDALLQMDDSGGNFTLHNYDIHDRPQPLLNTRTATWSVSSQYSKMTYRSGELQDLVFALIDVETLYLARPQARADHLKTLMDAIFEHRAEHDKGRGQEFNTKWEWLETGEDGIARCVSCGGMCIGFTFLSHVLLSLTPSDQIY